MKTTEWILVDTETSGLGQPIYCLEIAAQRMKGLNPDGPPFRALLNHDVEIEPQAEALHGYTRDYLRSHGRNPTEVHRDFGAYAGARPIVAYNLSFDWARVLEPELRRLNWSPAYYPGFCAMTLARRCIHETDGHKLQTLRGHFFPKLPEAAHHALDDVETTTKLFLEIIWPRLESAGIESYSAIAEFSRKTPLRECLDQVRNPRRLAKQRKPVSLDSESELSATIEGMLSDGQIVDAEVWVLKHWLDSHPAHRSELAERSRRMLEVAFADGELASWELDEIRAQLSRLIGSASASSKIYDFPAARETSQIDATGEKKRRLSLTKRQLEEETGTSLLNLLTRIVADGKLSDSEIKEISTWLLENQSADLPAIGHLLDLVKEILADGQISESERIDLFIGIEKVLPVTDRRIAKSARETAAGCAFEQSPKIGRDRLKPTATSRDESRSSWNGDWRGDPMTDAQSNFINSLGGSISSNATKGEASDLIGRLLGEKPITNRQQMVMRFWARDRQTGEGPREISEWMDEFYREDGDRKLAWELFKNESEDDGLQGNPSRVPFGVGPKYLSRIKEGGEAALPRFRSASAGLARSDGASPSQAHNKSRGRWTIGLTLGAVASVIFLVSRPRHSADTKETYQPTEQANVETKPAKITPIPTSQPSKEKSGVAPAETALRIRRLKITGIIGGAQRKTLIDGKALGVGDIIDKALGVVIESIDAEKRTVTFIDLNGAIYTRTLD